MNFLFIGGPEHGKFHAVPAHVCVWHVPVMQPISPAYFIKDFEPRLESRLTENIETYVQHKVQLIYPVVRSVFIANSISRRSYDLSLADALGKALDSAMVTEDAEPWELVEYL